LTFALINDPRYPTFNIGQKDNKPLFWRFPIVRAKPGEPAEQFTIDEARRTLTRMGMRFVWWDWTCIPQEVSDDNFAISLLTRLINVAALLKRYLPSLYPLLKLLSYILALAYNN
jgi:hypothetical protein